MLPVPYEKLRSFREKLGLNENDFSIIEPFRDIFILSKENFADYLYDFFLNIPETGIYLTHYSAPGFLKKAWADWFGLLFGWRFDNEFPGYLWGIGIRHVEVNLDQRYSNLAFSVTRQFCERIIQAEVPPEKMQPVASVVGKLLDLCILIETDAYIEAHARCNMEIIKGVADRVRNKITTIGGNIRRLKKKASRDDPSFDIFETLISDSSVCESMVADTKTFIEMSQREVKLEKILIEELISRIIEQLDIVRKYVNMRIETEFDKKAPCILGDTKDMQALFFHLLQNSVEAADPENPQIRVSSATNPSLQNRVQIEIFNTGIPVKTEDPDKLFSPFYSTKNFGSGFGLAIADLAVKKNYGRLKIKPVPAKGTTVTVILPAAI